MMNIMTGSKASEQLVNGPRGENVSSAAVSKRPSMISVQTLSVYNSYLHPSCSCLLFHTFFFYSNAISAVPLCLGCPSFTQTSYFTNMHTCKVKCLFRKYLKKLPQKTCSSQISCLLHILAAVCLGGSA